MRGKTNTATLQPDQFLTMTTRGYDFLSNTILMILKEEQVKNRQAKAN
ncbi:hypothetical protein [Labilibaculum filiforme]|nr:hypothetical protein [Labilibaculum filiforme]